MITRTLSQREVFSSSLSEMGDIGYEEEEDTSHINQLWGIHDKLNKLRGHMSKHKIVSSIEDSIDDKNEDQNLPQTYIVLRTNPNVSQTALEWLINKIRGRRRDGGAELLVFKEPYDPDEGLALHISATKAKLLEVAEEIELLKPDRNGEMREFTVNDLDDFLPESMGFDDLLSVSERQIIVNHELENIRALTEDCHIGGYPEYTLHEGQSIFHKYIQLGLIEKMYPLHDQEALKKLGRQWYLSLFRKQPFEEIRSYFGENIALYFAFLGFYTTALLVPMILGFLQLLVSKETVPFFCIFNVIWVTVFLEIWKRKSNEYAFRWGTIGMTYTDEARPMFRGRMAVDPISDKVEPQYPLWKTHLKVYCVSFPIIALCLSAASFAMFASFWSEDYLAGLQSPIAAKFIIIPSGVYTGTIHVMNTHYKKLAVFLTRWENHRTQTQYDKHRIIKLVIFEFINYFMSLFYIAFVYQDLALLRKQLATMLIVRQAINNIQEAVIPVILRLYAAKVLELKNYLLFWKEKTEKRDEFVTFKSYTLIKDIPEIRQDDSRLKSSAKEGKMESYDETYDDYLEMFIQFGYVVLFSSVYPAAAFWAVLNNILEIRSDALKLCLVFRRPLGKKVKDIGAWQTAFEVLGALSILTNCGLLCLSPGLKPKSMSLAEWILIFVCLEHFLLGLRYILYVSIPDKPDWVKKALAKRFYKSRQALKLKEKDSTKSSRLNKKSKIYCGG